MIVIIDCGSAKTPLIEQVVYEFEDTLVVPLLEFNSADHPAAIGFILSGAPVLLTESNPEPYLNKVSFLLTTDIPVLGICFGHQLLGLTYGAFASRQREDRDLQTIEIVADCPLFNKLPTTFEQLEDHCETISIPPNFVHVGVSDQCVNEAMMHTTKPLFGVQFHPEASGNFGAVIFENFVHICHTLTASNT
jgi:GMP synthase (glutamine-hydrolysing)